MKRILLLLAVLCVCDGLKFGQLCSGNASNRKRTSDRRGQGHYGARRCVTRSAGGVCIKTRPHHGLDIVCDDNDEVLAPFDVSLNGQLVVSNDPRIAAINQGIKLSGEGLCFKLFYVCPDQTSGTVRKGQKIGTMLPMQSVYPGITSHVHVQMCDKSDPTTYF